MLVFNCTQDASDFFSRIHKGKKISSVQSPPSRNIAEDEVTLAAAGRNPAELSQWLVHVDKAKRKTVVVAIHLATRYCMVFCNVKKGDAEGFVRDFKARWVTSTLDHAMKIGVLELINPESMEEQFLAATAEVELFKRGDRSAQGHLNEALWRFMADVYATGHLPIDEYEALRVDTWLNDTLVNVKSLNRYLSPDEEMLIHFLQRFCDVSNAQADEVRELRARWRREISELSWGN